MYCDTMDLVGKVRGQGLAQDHGLVPDHGLVHEISKCSAQVFKRARCHLKRAHLAR